MMECQVTGCKCGAYYEGWHKTVDGFGIPTGLMIKTQVCKNHVTLLVGCSDIVKPLLEDVQDDQTSPYQ